MTISSINVGTRTNNSRLPVLINSIRNPPYNATYVNHALILGKLYYYSSRLSRSKYRKLLNPATCSYCFAGEFILCHTRLGLIGWPNFECVIPAHTLFPTLGWDNNPAGVREYFEYHAKTPNPIHRCNKWKLQ